MNVLYLLIPVSLVLLVLVVAVFFWAVRNGQFDDLETPAYRILMDTEEPRRRAPKAPGTDTRAERKPADEDGSS
jgi:cbb3-type cytochrome oxidase maturation protein